MAWWDLFKSKNRSSELDPLRDLVLSKLQVGYFLDFDLKTWEVTRYNRYEFGERDSSDEWELTSGRERWYLERSEDDEVEWTWTRKIPITSIPGEIRAYILEHDDPPEQVVYQDITYCLDESGPAYRYPDGKGPAQEFIYWDFIDESGAQILTIEQWGEEEFEAAAGHYVEEYQFSNILPPGEEG